MDLSRPFRLRILSLLGASLLAVAAKAQDDSYSVYEIPDRLDLQTALQFAAEHNFEILKAKQRIEEQNGLIIEVRAQALPDLSVNGQYIELDEGLSEFAPPPSSQWGVSLDVRQTLYSGGGVRAALNVQSLIEDAALLELQSVIDDVLLLTRQGFYGALLARQEIEVQEDNVTLLEELLKNAQDRFDVGSGTRFEVLRAEVELANARPALIQARNDYRIAIEELRQILGFVAADGVALHKVPELVGDLPYSPITYDLSGAIEQALQIRPELKRLQKVEEAREEGVVIAKSGLRPEVSLVGSYEANKPTYSSSFDRARHGWTAGVQVNVPIFDGRRARGQIIQAKSQLAQAELETRQLSLAIEVEVRRALSELQAATELAQASIKVVEQAEEALRLADARYEAGEASQLDVLQARVSLTEARLNQAQAFYRYNVGEAQVRRAIGIADPYVER
ncbi:TolC family protein [Pelagicoccus sp. SDUM812003]|uniref:TolC family protein n=1 Tax=Pelagicoccus sp. SDUM812003 TaxID=3041267 RepID=UPI00280D662F|nr:TolC family protein [Pelagicoccus sp. SDUM812003]MDQ8202075.1 TolC family protein [Pelagicoccus sp. SDUM812003]